MLRLIRPKFKKDKYNVDELSIYHRSSYKFFKRLFDILVSSISLIFLSWFFLFISILIKLDDPSGNIFYSQTRIGLNGGKFKLYKFRSMIPNAEKQKKRLLKYNEIDGQMFKIHDDPRVTRIGHHIRKHSIDELPQLVNVLKGDMSLVGPRPPLPSEVNEYSNHDMQRLWVYPGLTGLWQVTGRNELSFEEMVSLDIYYINNSCFTYDIKIILKTIKVVMIPNDAV